MTPECPSCASRTALDFWRDAYVCELCGRLLGREVIWRRRRSWRGRLWLRIFAGRGRVPEAVQ